MSTVAICPHSGQVTRSVASAARVGPAETGNELADCTVPTPGRPVAADPDRAMTSVVGPVCGPIGIQSSAPGDSIPAPPPSSSSWAFGSSPMTFLLHRGEHPTRTDPELDPDMCRNLVPNHRGELVGRQMPGAGDGHLHPADVLRRITFPPDPAAVQHLRGTAGQHLDELP